MSETPPPPVVVAVTGATGLVGKAVLAHLLKSDRFRVVAIARNGSPLQAMMDGSDGRMIIKECDINDRAKLESAFEGVAVVVHAAGSVDPDGKREAVYKINVDGTATVLTAASVKNVKQMIHISSLSVITGQADQFNVDETAPLVLCGEVYADSKVEAERKLSEAMKTGSTSITILRPGFIYGPGERSWMPRVIDNIKHGRAVLVDGGTRQTNVIYVGNLAMAVERAILNPLAYGEIFNLTDGERVSKKLLFDEISEGLSLPLVQRSLPRDTLKPIFAFMSAIRPLFPSGMRAGLARFSPAAFRLVAVNQGFTIKKAEQILDYNNRISFKEGMAATLKDFR